MSTSRNYRVKKGVNINTKELFSEIGVFVVFLVGHIGITGSKDM